MKDFLFEVREKYPNKVIGIFAHRAPQLALEVISKNISWEEAIQNDWRKKVNGLLDGNMRYFSLYLLYTF